MRPTALLAAFAAVASASCATVTPADREATAITTTAGGAALVVSGSHLLAGSAYSVGMGLYAQSQAPAQLKDTAGGPFFVAAAIGGALGLVEVVAGGVLVQRGRCLYLDGEECRPKVANANYDATIEAAAKLKQAEQRLVDTCLSQKCGGDAECRAKGEAAVAASKSVSTWLDANCQ